MEQWRIQFYEGEDEAALIAEFVKHCAFHKVSFDEHIPSQFSPFQVAQYVFQNLREPGRAGQASVLWAKDLGIRERIRVAIAEGVDGSVDASEEALLKRAIRGADDPYASLRDRMAALRLAAEIKGYVKKAIEIKNNPSGGSNNGNAELVAEIAKLMPV